MFKDKKKYMKGDNMSGFENILPIPLREKIHNVMCMNMQIEEIRLRLGRPVILRGSGGEEILDYMVTKEDINLVYELVCSHSAYAYEEELRSGYITVQGGHRVGFCGKTAVENEHIKAINCISGINIRIAREIRGCGKCVCQYLIAGDENDKNAAREAKNVTKKKRFYNTLIASAPGGGKTTLLRDIIRIISDVYRINVGLVDERSEIAASYRGCPQNDVGIRTDIYEACPKTEGITRLIRTMSPEVIAVDEIGSKNDLEKLRLASLSGCGILATIHGEGLEDIKNNPLSGVQAVSERLYENELYASGLFKRYITIEKNHNALKVFDEKGEVLYAGL